MKQKQLSKLKVLNFILQDTKICIDLSYIVKILPLMQLEILPGGPPFVVGLLNLAGKSLPVIDLASRLNISRQPYTLETLILLCSFNNSELGLVIDGVIGIHSIEENTVQMLENLNSQNSPFIASITTNHEISLLLNMNYILPVKFNTSSKFYE